MLSFVALKSKLQISYVATSTFAFPEYIVNNVSQLLRWAVNNISSYPGSDPIIGRAVKTAQLMGWPAPIEGTVDLPLEPPFAWNYSALVLDPGGPGKALGTLAQPVVQLKQGQVFEFVLQNSRAINGAAEVHPWHAHGYSFWVVGQGQGIFDPETDVAKYNLDNPVLRDTVTLQPLSWVAVRFVADNPGAWLFHCHILSHHLMGMLLVMIVEPDAIGDVSASVEFCNDQQLVATNVGSGSQNGDSPNASPTNGSPTNGSPTSTNGTSTSGALHFCSGVWATAVLVVLLAEIVWV